LKALLALGLTELKDWCDRLLYPPDVAFHGAQKVTKAKLTVVLDLNELKRAADAAGPVRLLASGRGGPRLFDVATPISKFA
jgi:hypothetical protein